MIQSVEVHNFQSLRSVKLALGRFTVIVGPSSSGKSALMRAFKAVASNMNGSGSITRGAKAAAITVRTDEHLITLERSETSGQYRLVGADGAERTFTKLNRAVPEDITRALRIQPVPTGGSSINFAGQFDRPYLLVDSGANVARILGELTNVDIIFNAVREANRRRRADAATLSVREGDLARLSREARRFSDLPARLHACARAEQSAARAESLSRQVTSLQRAIDALEVAQDVVARSQTLLAVPADTALLVAEARLARFRSLVKDWVTGNTAIATATDDLRRLSASETELHERLHTTLVQAGQCPTCGQTVT